MSDLTFGAPWRLLLLLAVAALAAGYVVLQRRRTAYAVRFADVDLLASVAPRHPGWRRHVSAGLLVAALAVMTAAFARPAAAVEVPREAATVVVALDTSLSMEATDVSPSRFAAAQDAAAAFVADLPESFEVGLVSFAGTASVQVAPTDDRAAVVEAIRRLQLGQGTAIGEAVAASVATATQVAGQAQGEGAAPARVVLLSDGSNTQGRSLEDAVGVAASAGVPVSTIAYGTADGTVTVDGQTVRVPVDADALAQLAAATGGQAYEATSAGQLADVYDDIGEQVGTTTEHREVTAGFAGLALLLAVAAAGTSLAWSPRMV
ncbi:VWA domain-containing protein [Kineococcus glutinatus]|uniref:VWA domain-containing protein n=1 Tax=Kineococcus glutinatus TaxID=1070872 RepID=A0ABP9IBE4_9ACTN